MIREPEVRQPQIARPKSSAQTIDIAVIGLPKSGKSTFIKSISQYTEWQDKPHYSWYFGRVRANRDLILHFLEPPSTELFDFIWIRDLLSNLHATGYIIMVDSSRPKSFGPFVSILYTLRGMYPEAPLVVAANKQDHHRAWKANDIQMGLGLRDYLVMPCIAQYRDSVKEVVIELLRQMSPEDL